MCVLSKEIKKLPCDWKCLLNSVDKDTIKRVDKFLFNNRKFYPSSDKFLKPFKRVSFSDVKVVIVGQCPYPNPLHATGLPFSAPKDEKMPRGVANIYKAIISDIHGGNYNMPDDGCLAHLPQQGVLLLNRIFTTSGPYKTHPKGDDRQGWEEFSEAIIKLLSKKLKPSVFLLWGKPAWEMSKKIKKNNKKHLILCANHPSPLGNRGNKPLLKQRHFSKANKFLKKRGEPAIKWLP